MLHSVVETRLARRTRISRMIRVTLRWETAMMMMKNKTTRTMTVSQAIPRDRERRKRDSGSFAQTFLLASSALLEANIWHGIYGTDNAYSTTSDSANITSGSTLANAPFSVIVRAASPDLTICGSMLKRSMSTRRFLATLWPRLAHASSDRSGPIVYDLRIVAPEHRQIQVKGVIAEGTAEICQHQA